MFELSDELRVALREALSLAWIPYFLMLYMCQIAAVELWRACVNSYHCAKARYIDTDESSPESSRAPTPEPVAEPDRATTPCTDTGESSPDPSRAASPVPADEPVPDAVSRVASPADM